MGTKINIKSTIFLNLFSLFTQSLAWLQTLKCTFVWKSAYFMKIFAVTQHFRYSFKHNCFCIYQKLIVSVKAKSHRLEAKLVNRFSI